MDAKALCEKCRYYEECKRDCYYCPPLLYFYDFYKKIEAIEDELRLTLLKVLIPRSEAKVKMEMEAKE